MVTWTAFVDESGLFEPSEQGWLPGLRLVAGVLVPLALEQAEAEARGLLDRALDDCRLLGTITFVHASELSHGPSLAQALLRSERCPADLRAKAERAGQFGVLAAEGHEALTALRRETGAWLAGRGGWALGVSEYGCPRTTQNRPAPLPYPRMLRSWLEHALLQLALRQQGPCRLHAVVAHRGGALPAHDSIWQGRLGKLRDERGHAQITVSVRRAQEVAGLQVADLVAHAMGPGAEQAIPPGEALVARRNEAALASLFHRKFHTDSTYLERDANLDFRTVNEATSQLGHPQAFERIAAAARALPPTPLPVGHYPASLEACARTVPAMRGLWA